MKKTCGCPGKRSLCDHYNLLALFPEVSMEWDYEKNGKGPETYSPNSTYNAWWLCSKNPCGCHNWQSEIFNRTYTKGNLYCPYCKNREPCRHKNLLITHANICEEWDYIKNIKSPSMFTSGSDKKVWWLCSKNPCGCHNWEATISSRTIKGCGCLFCGKQNICAHKNFAISHSHLLKEWDYELNKNAPETYHFGSKAFVWWICSNNPCGCHKWEAAINARTNSNNPSGCPFCNSSRPCQHNNLLILYPELCIEWDYSKNIINPQAQTKASKKKVWWLCNKNHSWSTAIQYRTSPKNPTGCPICCDKNVSRAQIKWIDQISKKYNLNIQTAKTSDGEYVAYGYSGSKYKLDGYVKIANIDVGFEFDGCYWHGCPKCYLGELMNKKIGKTHGELNARTQFKRNDLISAGYHIISIRECEYFNNFIPDYPELI